MKEVFLKDHISKFLISTFLICMGGFFLWPFFAGWLMGTNPEGGMIRVFSDLGVGGTTIIGTYQLFFTAMSAYCLVMLWQKPRKLYSWARATIH